MKTEIEIPVTALKSALPGLAKIVGRSSNLPVLNCIKVALDKAQQFVTLQAHNLDEIATVRLPNSTTGTSGELLVPLETLSKIIRGCPADQSIRLIANSQETKIRYTVAGQAVDRSVDHIQIAEWPAVKVIDQEAFPLDDAFKEALKEAIDCASTDSSRYVLNGACLDVSAKEAHYVVGTDGRQLYAANSFRFQIPESLIVPTRKFVAWPGFLNDGPWRLRMLPAVKIDPEDKKADKSKEEPPWLRIESDRWSYIARSIDGTFPNWRQVVPSETTNWTRVTLAPASIQMMLQAMPLLPGADITNQTVVLESAANNLLTLRARGRDDKADTRIEIPDVQIVGKPFEVALNRIYLLRALRFELSEIRIDDSLTPMVFSKPNRTMIVMPVRMEAPAPAETAPEKNTPAPPETSEPNNDSAVIPSPAETNNPTETERNSMSATATTIPERGNLRAHSNGNGEGEETRSSFKAALEHIERIKTNLRDVISDLNEAVALLKAAEKEQRATSKEIDAVRSKLREIQSVKL